MIITLFATISYYSACDLSFNPVRSYVFSSNYYYIIILIYITCGNHSYLQAAVSAFGCPFLSLVSSHPLQRQPEGSPHGETWAGWTFRTQSGKTGNQLISASPWLPFSTRTLDGIVTLFHTIIYTYNANHL